LKFTDDEFLLLQAIHKSSVLDFPCPDSIVAKAASFIKTGMVAVKGEVAKNGMADLYIPDEAKWTLLASGRILAD
jgi:hypothetical protein